MIRNRPLLTCALIGALIGVQGTATAAGDSRPGLGRIEARSSDLLAVGMVSGDKMTLRLSRIVDNSPVHDAVVNVVLRGAAHAATADADGSYSLQTPDLGLPGAATVELQIKEGEMQERLKGTLDVAGANPKSEDSNSARQLWWWVLNFAVCIAFLWMFSRRKKAAED